MEGGNNDQHVSLTIDGVTYDGNVTKTNFDYLIGKLDGPDGENVFLLAEEMYEDGTLKKGVVKASNGFTYEGEFSDEQPSGKGKMTYYEDGQLSSIYDGEWRDGMRSGYGKITHADGNTEEGEFLENQRLKIFSKYKESDLNYYSTFDKEGRIKSYRLLSKEPEWEDGKIKMDELSEIYGPSGWLYKTTIDYDEYISTEHPSEVIYECRSYEEDGSRKARVKIFPNRINELLSGEATKSLEELLVQGAIAITWEGKGEESPRKVTEPEEAREILKTTLEGPIKLRSGKVTGFSEGNDLESQLMMLSMIEDKDLKNVRLWTEKVSYSSMTSLLESVGINEGNLGEIGEDYIVMLAGTDAGDHTVCFIVDLKKMKEALKGGKDWKSLDTSNEIFIHCFNSSREGTFGALEKNLDNVNLIVQELGTCWFHGLAAAMAALENPEMVGRVLDGKIPGYESGKHEYLEDSDVPNEFMLKHVLELRKIESILGISLGEGGLLVEGIVSDDFKNRMTELAKSEKLLEELSKRIDEAFKTFEEKLKKLGSEVPELLDTEYEDYKKKTTKEYGKNLIAKATPPATDNAKEVPEFLEGSEKLLVMWEQLYDLESRLKAGLEKFKEEREKIVEQTEKEEKEKVVEQTEKKKTEKLNIVNILRSSAKTPEGKAAVSLVLPPSPQPDLPVSADTKTNVNETIQV